MTSSPDSEPRLPTAADIDAAAARLEGHAVATPLLESPALNARLKGRLLVKAECLQRTGSFKFRGAYNALAQLDAAARKRGVVAYSSGNHAQGVAAAAELLAMPAVIVMPGDAPRIKVENTRGYGAEIVFYDRYREAREDIAQRIATERGAELLPPYDDARVIAGQGTVGLAQRLLAGSLVVTDAEVAYAMAVAFADLKLVTEPSGAAALAAILAGRTPIEGRVVAVILSGGNVDGATFATALARA